MLNDLHGLLLIDKPKGVTSFHVIECIQKILSARFGKKKKDLPKMGHGGTLDPFATGLLILGIGDGVKLSRYLLESDKAYLATMKWGQTTASGDATDPITESGGSIPNSIQEVQQTADRFAGAPYLQTPPMHSAKKIDGQRLYELARKGQTVDRPAKECHLSHFKIIDLDLEQKTTRFSVVVTSGTFIRTLAQDLAIKMNGLAHLTELRRTHSGRFKIEDAATLECLEESTDWTTLPAFIPFDEVLSSLPQTQLTSDEASRLIQGKQETLYPCLKNAGLLDEKRVALYLKNKLIAVAIRDKMDWGIERVFTTLPRVSSN